MALPIIIGCCGWPEARAKYFQHFLLVELQDTFYDPPSLATIERRRQEAPPHFAFTLKAWQLITHPPQSPTYRRLKTPIPIDQHDRYGFFRPTAEVRQAWQKTAAIASALQAAVIVFQCPPSFSPTPENKANLEAFFSGIERGHFLLAWEPRGKWTPQEVGELCQRLGLVHCVDPFAAEPTCGASVYFRLHGRGGYRYRYTDDDLEALRQMCLRQVEMGRTPVYCLFNNVYMLEDALRFQRLLAQAPQGHEPGV
ncbi:MAG: DUF72 domain-containing protein [Dehalococcoidia bacterium]